MMAKIDLQKIDASFRKIKKRYDARSSHADALICKQGFYKSCTVLKLQKPSWTNDRMDLVQNSSGIFFSIWINEELAQKSRVNYNIHALKLRQLKGYSITSKDFAQQFRKNFAAMQKAWPNVSVDYGPLTLMEGWADIDMYDLEENILLMLQRFHHVSLIVDRLLAERSR
jgi:hypothetical protein